MTDTRRKSAGDISGGGGGDGGSSSISSEGEDEADAIRSSNRPKKDSNSSSNKRLIRKLSSHLLDSNGESESDEEISKLQRVIKDQAKELNDERQASKKVCRFYYVNIDLANIFLRVVSLNCWSSCSRERRNSFRKKSKVRNSSRIHHL